MHYITGILVAATCVGAALSLPPCTCTRNYLPVCGSDGTTYSNECLLNCERHKYKRDLTVAREGACEPPPADNCICTFEFNPICGSDGTTYPNKCSLGCAKSQAPALEMKHEGTCKGKREAIQVARLEPCMCTREMKPVCGSDGATYNNPCLLDCATQANPKLNVRHTGPCEDRAPFVEIPREQSLPSCACTRNLLPVCGSDGTTYNNPCLLNCATKDNPSLRVEHSGPCDGRVSREACACTRNLAPVCASDGNTYSNLCVMRCKGGDHLTVVHHDACQN